MGLKLVHIEWSDAHHHGPGEWLDPDELQPGVRVVTVGFLLNGNHRHYTVASTIDEGGSATGVFSIPKACVRRLTVISP